MRPNDGRVSAIVTSYVKDLSKISSITDYVGMFACITPWGPVNTPTIIRDVEMLDKIFGDPRIDSDLYVDLYSVRELVKARFVVCLTRVESGTVSTFTLGSSPSGGGGRTVTIPITPWLFSIHTIDTVTSPLTVSLVQDSGEFRYTTSGLADTSGVVTSWTAMKNELFSVDYTYGSYLNEMLFLYGIDTGAEPLFEFSVTVNPGESVNIPLPRSIVEATFTLKEDRDGVFSYQGGVPEDVIRYTPKDGEAVDVSVENIGDYLDISFNPAEVGGGSTDPHTVDNDVILQSSVPVGFILGGSSGAGFLLEGMCALSGSIDLKASVVSVLPETAPKRLNLTLSQDGVELDSASISIPHLASQVDNKTIVATLNSTFGTFVSFSLPASLTPHGFELSEALNSLDGDLPVSVTQGKMDVTLQNYLDAFATLSDRRYQGTLISDLTLPIVSTDTEGVRTKTAMGGTDRRAVHYAIKSVAAERKDLTCIFSTPNFPDPDIACQWVSSTGPHSQLWEYGSSSAVDYSDQSFYCEIYWNWLRWTVPRVVAGKASSQVVDVAPSIFVCINTLKSFRERGSWYPVAGDQGGVLPDEVAVISNPKHKMVRDKLVSYRINPVYDTGTRGVQIYGNETLNPQFTDLSSAHIGRTLVRIRTLVDEYTETLKFSLNEIRLWRTWINHVTQNILTPIQSGGGLYNFSVDMGETTTTAEEISNRFIRGVINLQFNPDAEVFELGFVVNSSSLRE